MRVDVFVLDFQINPVSLRTLPSMMAFSLAVSVVTVAAAAEDAPMAVPSMLPPLMSQFVTDPKFVIVLPAKDRLAGRLIVGLPAVPLWLVTAISLAVPTIFRCTQLPGETRTGKPEEARPATAVRSSS